ncbi:unnamed protein product [Psylliodes chrysocephalus]|uniref:Uncharacterized protein n=1 Tax=Psylliodes chrysocephalus TaxID=3402493 RepID=A0A9P0GFJ2_9CUCU|nr:unnamed protein product [Psylliodes chrysocephala]
MSGSIDVIGIKKQMKHQEDSNGVEGTYSEDNSIIGSLNPPNLAIIKKGILPNPHYVCGYNEDQPSAARLQYEELDVSGYHTLSFNPAVYFRVRGDANSSSTLLSLLVYLGIDRQLAGTRHLLSLCLSDGIGGFTSVLYCNMQDGTIVWHTYPEEFVQMSKPTVAWQTDETRRNIVITDHIEQGLYDLQVEHTWEAFRTIFLSCVNPDPASTQKFFCVVNRLFDF